MALLTIGGVAKRANVGVETIRFYEREGLISEPPRRASGYRVYPESTVDRLRFIKRAKDLGFSLREIKELLELRIAPGATCEQIKGRAKSKIGDIEEKMRTLKRMKQALDRLTEACSGNGSVSDCPILEALDEKKKR